MTGLLSIPSSFFSLIVFNLLTIYLNSFSNILIHSYDALIFPAQFVFSIIAIVLLVFLARGPSKKLNMFINLFLMFCYLWIGIVFFLIFNRGLSIQMHYFQPILMFIIAFLFGLDVFMKKTNFEFPKSHLHRAFMLFFGAYGIIGYPLVGWILGHPYSVEIFGTFSIWVPILGVFPCPTTIFSLALLGAALPKADKKVMIPLLFWALCSITGPPILMYGVYEDFGLFLAGIYSLVMFVMCIRRKRT